MAAEFCRGREEVSWIVSLFCLLCFFISAVDLRLTHVLGFAVIRQAVFHCYYTT